MRLRLSLAVCLAACLLVCSCGCVTVHRTDKPSVRYVGDVSVSEEVRGTC